MAGSAVESPCSVKLASLPIGSPRPNTVDFAYGRPANMDPRYLGAPRRRQGAVQFQFLAAGPRTAGGALRHRRRGNGDRLADTDDRHPVGEAALRFAGRVRRRAVIDEFGVAWSTNEIDRGSPIGPCLPEPDLSGYRFPMPAAAYRFENLGEWTAANAGYYTFLWVGDLWERAAFMRGMEAILLDLALHPRFVEELLRGLADYILRTMEILFARFAFDGVARERRLRHAARHAHVARTLAASSSSRGWPRSTDWPERTVGPSFTTVAATSCPSSAI